MFKISELIEATGAKARYPNCSVEIKGVSTDSRTIKPGEAFLAVQGDNFDGHAFIDAAIDKGAACIICRNGSVKNSAKIRRLAVPVLETRDTVRAYGDIARFHRNRFSIPVIGVTGSNGKTTVKDMVAWVLSKKMNVLKNPGTENNHIGLPATLLDLKDYHEIIVVEIGTNHFGEVEYLTSICRPNIGIITNIGPSHLAYLSDERGVFREKSSLVRNLVSPSIAVLNSDDKFLRELVFRNGLRPCVVGYGVDSRVDFSAFYVRTSAKGVEFRVNRKTRVFLKTPGSHNVYNALAAVAVGTIFGIGYTDIARRLAAFEFPGGRLKSRQVKSVRFIDDTYNANPVSLKQALIALRDVREKGRKITVLGDMLELGSREKQFHYEAGVRAAEVSDCLITVGKLSRCAARAALQRGFSKQCLFMCDSAEEAKDVLWKDIALTPGDVVLVKGSRRLK